MDFVLLFLISLFGLYIFKNYTGKLFLDIPNQRSMHKQPVKRAGGLVFSLVFLISLVYYSKQNKMETLQFYFLGSGVCFFWLLGLADDLWNLSFKWKAPLEILFLSLLFYFSGISFEIKIFQFLITKPFSWVILIVYIFFTVNLCNFMDGLDLYLSVSFIIFAINLYSTDFKISSVYLQAVWLYVTCLLPFLYFNFPNAKMFMGDSGSLPIGFMVAVFPFFIEDRFHGELSLAPFMLPMFWVDGVYTILIRIKRKQNVFLAHKEHLYQKIQIQLLTKKQTILTFLYFNFLPAFLLVIHSFGIIKNFWIVYFFIFLITHVVYFYLYFLVQAKLKETPTH